MGCSSCRILYFLVEDIDECKVNTCAGGCENYKGSYKCHCSRGLNLAADGRSCSDVNECVKGAGCQYGCINTYGSFECSCPAGHRSKGARVCYGRLITLYHVMQFKHQSRKNEHNFFKENLLYM